MELFGGQGREIFQVLLFDGVMKGQKGLKRDLWNNLILSVLVGFIMVVISEWRGCLVRQRPKMCYVFLTLGSLFFLCKK